MTSRSSHMPEADPGSLLPAPEKALRILLVRRPTTRKRGHVGASQSDAISYAAWLGANTDVRIQVATSLVRPWPSASLSQLGGKYRKWVKKSTEETAAQVEHELKEIGLPKSQWANPVSVFADGTNEAVLISEAARNFRADLILLGSDASAEKGHFLTTSIAETLLHFSPVTVGMTPNRVKLSKKGPTRINFAYLPNDVEEHTPAPFGLHYAAVLAARYDVPLRLLAVNPTGLSEVDFGLEDVVSGLRDEWREHSLSLLDKARDKVVEAYPQLEVSTRIASGHGWDGALNCLKWKKGDLLCLRSLPMGSLARVFVGSTASELLPFVHVPILVHPERKSERSEPIS